MNAPRPAPQRGQLKKQLYRLAVGRSDVGQALAATEVLRREVRSLADDSYQPLLHAIAIAYARPFVTTRAGSTIGDRWARYRDPLFQDTHNKLLELRHKFVAHSDPMERTVKIVPPGVPLYEGAAVHFTQPGIAVRDIGYPLEWFAAVSATAADLGGRLHEEVERLLRELYGARSLPSELFPLTLDDEL